jgi:predicted transcriptional regulator
VKESLTRGYTRRSLKVKPQNAITKDAIICCICGKSMNSINARHLASHNGLTKAGYLKLCDYPANQVLMSLNHLAKMRTQVHKAQKAREKKQNERGNAPVKVRKNKKEA